MPIVFKAGVQPPPSFTIPVRVLLLGLSRIIPSSTATITDWYRTAAQNLAVGGAPGSKHTVGTAVDVRDDAAGAILASSWRAIGGKVIDERATRAHWHLELPF